jgi:hypothetical protein
MTAIGFLLHTDAIFIPCLASDEVPVVERLLLRLHVLPSRPLLGLVTVARSMIRGE